MTRKRMRKNMEHLVFLNVNNKVSAIILEKYQLLAFRCSLGNPLKMGEIRDKNSPIFNQNVIISKTVDF